MRHNYILTQPIYAERAKLVRRIPYFWAIVIEEAPEEIDRRIQPCDTAVLSSLQRVEVTRFEISPEAPEAGEPRSVKIAFFFGENAWFEDRVLEKCFWYRTGKDGWTGLVSDPVQIHWKEGKDLTEGLLDEAVNVFKTDAEIKRYPDQVQSSLSKGQSKQNQLSEMIRVHKSLVQRLVNHLRNTPQDAVSFFAWFGYRGRDISAGVSAEAMRKEVRKRKLFKDEGTSTSGDDIVVDNYEDEPKDSEAIATSEFEGKELDFEIFPAGEELAVAISEDLYPGAIKYFSEFWSSRSNQLL